MGETANIIIADTLQGLGTDAYSGYLAHALCLSGICQMCIRDSYKTILNWRKGNDVIAKGSMVQFMVPNGVYACARQYEGKTIFVILNGTDAETTVPLKFYKEILKNSSREKIFLAARPSPSVKS